MVLCSESYYYSIGEADSIISISTGVGGLEILGDCKTFCLNEQADSHTGRGGENFIHL